MNSQIIQKKTDEFISNFTPDELAKYATVLLSRTRKERFNGDLSKEQADKIISQFVDKHLTHIPSERHFKYVKALGDCSVKEMQHEWMSIYYEDQKRLLDLLERSILLLESLLVETTILQIKNPKEELILYEKGWLEKTAHVTMLLIDQLNSNKKNLEDLLSCEEWELTDIIPQEAKTMKTPDAVIKRLKNPDYKDPDLKEYVPLLITCAKIETEGADYLTLWHQLYDRMKEDISGDDSIDEPVLEEK